VTPANSGIGVPQSTAAPLQDVPGTKFTVPGRQRHLVRRQRLTSRLEAGLKAHLTLLSAPPGYGKTTLLVDWLRARAESGRALLVAWVTLDESDNDPGQFLRVLAAAIRTVAPRVGDSLLAALAQPTSPPWRVVLTGLVNDLLAAPRGIVVVLEDYHVIRTPSVHDAVEFLFTQLPSHDQVVIATREDPPFPLAELRAKGALCELRAADLRFTPAETVAFFTEVMGLPVSAADAAALETRTEGWVAGLQLAALSMRGLGPQAAATFGGQHRDVLDYLAEDVLNRQSPSVQTFLLRTSVLDRLTGPLCEAILNEAPAGGAQAMLERITRANLFLVPLDAEGRWYRYHQLFAEFLRHRLETLQPALLDELHSRASTWHEGQGFTGDAIEHALAARSYGRAALLIERSYIQLIFGGRLRLVLQWLSALPAEIVHSRPALSLAHAWSLFLSNRPEEAEIHLKAAEQHVGTHAPSGDGGFIPAQIALLRAEMSQAAGDLTRSIALATQTEALLTSNDVAWASLTRTLMAETYLLKGDVTAACERLVVAAATQRATAHLPTLKRAELTMLARMRLLRGELHRAVTDFAQAAQTFGLHVETFGPAYCFGLGDLRREWNHLDEAQRLLERGVALISQTNVVYAPVAVPGYIALARLRAARGDGSGALTALDECVALARQRQFAAPVFATLAAARAHIWLQHGNLTAAGHWAGTSGLGTTDTVSYLREREYLVLARVLGARKEPAALGLLGRLLADADAHGRGNSMIEILAVRAVVRAALGHPAEGLADLARALALGEPEGHVRVFVDEGAPMASLLRRAHAAGMAPGYVVRLLEVFRESSSGPGPDSTGSEARSMSGPGGMGDPLVEPLTAREGEILQLVAAGASNGDIAAKLFVSTSTVKGHVHHIIGKLGVKGRTQAIAKARELRLL